MYVVASSVGPSFVFSLVLVCPGYLCTGGVFVFGVPAFGILAGSNMPVLVGTVVRNQWRVTAHPSFALHVLCIDTVNL